MDRIPSKLSIVHFGGQEKEAALVLVPPGQEDRDYLSIFALACTRDSIGFGSFGSYDLGSVVWRMPRSAILNRCIAPEDSDTELLMWVSSFRTIAFQHIMEGLGIVCSPRWGRLDTVCYTVEGSTICP